VLGIFSYYLSGIACGFDGKRDLQLDDPAAHSDGDRLSAIAGAELLHDVLDVYLYCLFRNEEFVGNVPVSVSVRDLTQDLNLATSESLVAVVFRQICRNLGRNALFPGMNLANNFHQLLGRTP
jgi:hypothetical protein